LVAKDAVENNAFEGGSNSPSKERSGWGQESTYSIPWSAHGDPGTPCLLVWRQREPPVPLT